MGLDILTPRGQDTVAQLERAVAIWGFHWPGWAYCATPVEVPAAVDAVLVDRSGVIRAVVEAKCRRTTLDNFRTAFGNEWLITMDKLTRASLVSQFLAVPLVGFLYLVDDDVLLTQRLTNSDGQFCVPFRCDNTRTQRTVNGGEAVRANAYVDMHGSKEYRFT